MPLPIAELDANASNSEIESESEIDWEQRQTLINQIIERVDCQMESATLEFADFPFTVEEEEKAELYRRQMVWQRIVELDHSKLVHLVFNLIEMTECDLVMFNRYQLMDANDIRNAGRQVLEDLSLSQLREKWFALL